MPVENTNSNIASTMFVNEYVIDTLNIALNTQPFFYWSTLLLLEFYISANGQVNVFYEPSVGIFVSCNAKLGFLFGLYTLTSDFTAQLIPEGSTFGLKNV
jgi:hypothetical protein